MRLAQTIVCLGLALSAGHLACADGGLIVKEVGQAVSMAASPKQEAILVRDGDLVQVTLRTHYRSGPDELAWVVPVPTKPLSVTKGRGDPFRELESRTTPRFTAMEGTGGCGIACAAGDATPVAGEVIVAETGRAGIFDYTVLTATGVEALTSWLRDRQFAVPAGAEAVFQRYVDKGWYWLAIRVRSEESNKPTLALHPIKYTYHDTALVYPLVISSVSADKENEILLYVLATGRYRCENWTNTIIDSDDLQLDSQSPSGTNYEKLVRQVTGEKGGHVFVTECAFPMDSYDRPLLRLIMGEEPASYDHLHDRPFWQAIMHEEPASDSDLDSEEPQQLAYLTRLRAIIAPEAMDRDVILVPEEQGGSFSNDRYFYVDGTRRKTAGAAVTVLILGAPWLALRLFCRTHRLTERKRC